MLSDELTILIVDDFPADRQRCCCYLNAQLNTTLHLLEAESGEKGFAQLEQTIPDVIVLGHSLPDMTSIEFIQQLQAQRRNGQPIIIVLTRPGDEETVLQALQSGAHDYLSKGTLTPEKLAQTITQAIARLHLEHLLHRNQTFQQILADCALKIYQAQHLEDVFNIVVHDIHRFLKCDRAVIYQFHPDMSGTIIAEAVSPGWVKTLGERIHDSFFQQCREQTYQISHRRVVNDISKIKLNDCHRRLLERFQVKAKVFVPIVLTSTTKTAETNLWGLLIVHQCDAPRQWDDLELQLLSDIAVQMAIAIQQLGLVQQLEQELVERRQAEQNLIQAHRILKQMNKELETRVEERTSTLATLNTQLQEEVHQRQHIQKCLLFRTAEFEAIFQAIPDAVMFTNTQHQIQSINPAFIKLFDYSAEELLGHTTQQLYRHPQDFEQQPPPSDTLSRHEQPHSYEILYRRYDGTLFIGETVNSDVRDSTGHRIGYLKIIRDISQRKQSEIARQQAELALRHSEQQFRAIFNQTFELVGLLNSNGVLLNINQTAIDFAGIPKTQVLHEPFWETHWWQHSPSAQRQLRYSIAQAQTGQFIRYEVEIQGDSGRREIIDFSLKPVSDGEDRVVWLLAEGRIITQRITLERELRAQKQLLSSFFDAASVAHVGACILDTQRRYIRVNSVLANMNGHSVQNHLGKRVDEILPKLSMTVTSNLDHVFQAQESVQNVEITGAALQQPDLSRYWLASYFPITDTDQTLQAVGMIVVEITHQKKIEKELMQLNRALHCSNQELEQFAYVASHDLREPLRKIRSYSELLAKRYSNQIDERADRYISYIVNGVSRMNVLISDLLSYSQLGRENTGRTSVNLNDILRHVIDDLASIIQETQAHVVITTPLPTLVLNPSQTQQLLQNLIENAIKYRSDAPPLIQISATPITTGWQFSVTDNGIGIDPEFAERIFIIFQRLHTRDAYPGTGIGLAICKRVVEHHGGTIWLEPTPESGTTICFTLPSDEIPPASLKPT